MTELTQKEQIVLDVIEQICQDDYSADVDSLARATDMTVYSIKGVLGSLVKKNRALCEQEERADRLFYDIFYRDENGRILSYGEWS